MSENEGNGNSPEAVSGNEAEGAGEASPANEGSLGLEGAATHADGTLGLETSDKGREEAAWTDVTAEGLAKLFPEKVTVGDAEHEYKASKGDVEALVGLANELKIPAEKLVAYHVGRQVDSAVVGQQEWAQQLETWQKEVMGHPTLGGAMWPQTRDKVVDLVNRFGDDNFKAFLAQTGGQAYLPVIEFLHKVAAQVPAKGAPASGQVVGNVRSLEDRLFPQVKGG